MQFLLGAALLVTGGGLWLRYRPKAKEGRLLCGMLLLMAAVALLGGNGGAAYLLVQAGMGAVVAACTAYSLAKETACRKAAQDTRRRAQAMAAARADMRAALRRERLVESYLDGRCNVA